MAFRDDADALHARIEGLEKELEEARTELRELRGVAAERDRLKTQLDALQPKPKPRPNLRWASDAPKPAASPFTTSRGAIALGVAILVLVVGLFVYQSVAPSARDSASATAENKAGDTRAPTIGVVDLDATPNPAPIPFTVTGTEQAPPPCAGYLPSAPQLVLRAASPTLVHITTRCNVDLVAVLTGVPTGALCDDDGGSGQQPLIETTVPAGETRLIVGTFSEGAQASCEIELRATALPSGVDEHGLALSGAPTLATIRLDGAPTSEAGYRGTIGVELIEVARVQSGCPGFVASVPDLVVDLAEPSIVRIDASSDDADLVLMLHAPDGSLTCDDDDGIGNSPRIAKRLPAGRYPVWVGTFQQVDPGTAFRVGVQVATIASEASTVVPSVDLSIDAPVHVTGQSGDELWAGSMWSDCAVPGYVPYRPTQTFRVAARGDVTIASGRGDLLLAVTPHDQRTATIRPCTVEPAWRATLDPGAYDLYVGTASGESTRSDIDLTLSVAPPSVLPYTP